MVVVQPVISSTTIHSQKWSPLSSSTIKNNHAKRTKKSISWLIEKKSLETHNLDMNFGKQMAKTPEKSFFIVLSIVYFAGPRNRFFSGNPGTGIPWRKHYTGLYVKVNFFHFTSIFRLSFNRVSSEAKVFHWRKKSLAKLAHCTIIWRGWLKTYTAEPC